ncbi:MAG: hypothetical protein PHC70_00200 [Patescibacteria group bacterium]|nr:hypothetical protein [Patescibacteria group bacterium]
MTSRFMHSISCLSVWRRASTFAAPTKANAWRCGWVALFVSLAVLLLAGRAQAALPLPAQYQECIVDHKVDLEQNGQHFTVITVTKDVPNCQLRNAIKKHPILDAEGNTVGEDEWLRSVYAANQDKTVRRGCVTTLDRKPPTNATEEELKRCPDGKVNYFAIPSERWKAYIYIPTTRMYTFFEQQALAAAKACSVLGKIPNPTDQVKQAIEDCAKSQVKDEKGKSVLPPVQAENPDPYGDTQPLRAMLAAAWMKVAVMKLELATLEWRLADIVTDRRNYANGFALTAVCLGLTMAGGAGLFGSNRRQKRKSKALAADLDQVRTELAVMSDNAKKYIADAGDLADKLSQKEADYNQLSSAAGDLGPLVNKLQGEIRAKKEEYDALLKNGMEVSRAHHEEREADRKRFAEQKRKFESELASQRKANKELQDKYDQLAAAKAAVDQELKATQAHSLQAALEFVAQPSSTSIPPPPSTETKPPSTETYPRPVACPAARPIRKETMQFLPVKPEELLAENQKMRQGLLEIIDSRRPGEAQIFGAVDVEVLVSRAKEVTCFHLMDGSELAKHALSVFREVEMRYLATRKSLEILLQSVDDVRAVWRAITASKLVISRQLEILIGDPLKEFFLDDAATLAKLLSVSQLASPISEVKSPVQHTLVPPDVFPANDGSHGSSGGGSG